MGTIVNFATEVVHRFVVELRYEFGQIYWDRAGRIGRSILSTLPNWDFDTVDVNRFQTSDREANLAFTFGHDKLDLSQTQTANVQTLLKPGDIGRTAETLSKLVVDTLELQFFPRIGYRVWHLYPTVNREESYRLIEALKYLRLEPAAKTLLGTTSDLAHRLVVDRGTHMVRIAIAPFEQTVDIPPSLLRAAKAKTRGKGGDKGKNQAFLDKLKAERVIRNFPQFGVLLDVDAYIEDPPYPDNLTVSNFVSVANDDFLKLKALVLESAS